MKPTAAISARNLTKRYGDLTAVDGIDFAVGQGECFGFLGPNGAGKTSIMKMIGCVSPVTDGELLVAGMDVRRDQRAVKSVLGVVSQADSLDPDLSVIQNLVAYARYFSLPRKTAFERAWDALELFQLSAKARQTPDKLSGGMRRRLLIARALLHQPSILVLDEPTAGLDPQSRHMVWEKLRSFTAQGTTVLVTTHYLEEAEYLCDRLVVMDQGRIVAEGAPRELIQSYAGEQVVEIRTSPERKAQVMSAMRERGLRLEDLGDTLVIYGQKGSVPWESWGLDGAQVVRRPANLEDAFLLLTGRGLREE